MLSVGVHETVKARTNGNGNEKERHAHAIRVPVFVFSNSLHASRDAPSLKPLTHDPFPFPLPSIPSISWRERSEPLTVLTSRKQDVPLRSLSSSFVTDSLDGRARSPVRGSGSNFRGLTGLWTGWPPKAIRSQNEPRCIMSK